MTTPVKEVRYGYGQLQVGNEVVCQEVYRSLDGDWATDGKFRWFTVMITRFPVKQFGYMVSVAGKNKFARQIDSLDDIHVVGLDMLSHGFEQTDIDMIIHTAKRLIDEYGSSIQHKKK